MMNRVQVGQKRAGTPLSNQIVKQRQAMPAQRNTRPAQAKDVKERFIFLCVFIVKWSFRSSIFDRLWGHSKLYQGVI